MAAREPELVVVGACGFSAAESPARAAGLDLSCPMVAVEGDVYYSRPAPRLADGVAQLAHLLHAEHALDPGLPEIWLERRAPSFRSSRSRLGTA